MTNAHRLTDNPVVLRPDQSVAVREMGPDFYAGLDRDFGGFAGHTLVAEYAFSQDWGMWERHPAGDETIYLLEGQAEFILAMPDGTDRSILLDAPGSYCVVPRGVWHTAKTDTPSRALFITPGAGTEHAPAPP